MRERVMGGGGFRLLHIQCVERNKGGREHIRGESEGVSPKTHTKIFYRPVDPRFTWESTPKIQREEDQKNM